MLEQAAQVAAQGVGLLRIAKGVLELAEYLGFAENHRVEAAGNAEDVADRILVLERENRLAEVVAELAVVMQPVFQAFAPPVVPDQVKLGPVAGGKQQRLIDPARSVMIEDFIYSVSNYGVKVSLMLPNQPGRNRNGCR